MATFKTRARAVDMLGRQQIAGVPTAISELFKNAHDAYADRVEVDYYRSDRLFVLRDDGVGMTEEEFQARWLTIGTESKLGSKKGLRRPPVDPRKVSRAILGEKGIGRLAIAAIGPQVLVLSQADRGKEDPPQLVAAYIHWGLFEVPGVDLDEIEIPIATFRPHTPPDTEDLNRMVDAAERSLDRISDRVEADMAADIRADFATMRALDPAEVEAYVPHLDLHSRRGTHFLIAAAYETLEADIKVRDSGEASTLEKLLLGFTNTMTPGHPEPVIETAFRDHPFEEVGDDLFDKERFFTPAEFHNADHHITGRFDEFGQFEGTVTVYGEPYENYRVAWPNAQGRPTRSGPFEIHLAAVQPEARSTTLPPEAHQELITKTKRFGGLYIFRDGIRILPYGDVDYDWLEIEKRRTFSAQYYYFSHRNIFGAVLLSHEENADLSEKAGREGFRENTAYRQLRSILTSFLTQVAGDFFRDSGAHADRYQERKGELQKQHETLKKREASVKHKRDRFRSDLSAFFEAYDDNEPQKRALELAERVERALDAAQAAGDPAEAAARFLAVESNARAGLRDLEEYYRVTKPRGVGMSRALLREYDDYQDAYARLRDEVFLDVRSLVEGVVTDAAERARVELDRRIRIERALEELAARTRREAKAERVETQETLDELRKEVRGAAKDTIGQVEQAVTGTLSEFASTDMRELGDEAVVALRDRLERQILEVRERSGGFLRYVRAQLEAVDVTGELSQVDQIEAIEQRNIDLEERAEYDLQLAQLGMAVDVINHEFDASIRAIRNDLRRLRAWADINDGLDELYSGLRSSFDHLDGYLTLFTPLHRRLNRKKVVITGSDIIRYVRELFAPRFDRHAVELEATPSFARWSVTEYPSSFYPVFVNLLDNAIFWLDERKPPRTIRLDADGSHAYVSNNGPGIPERRRDLIFDQGTSFKPGGRGLGLFISRESLRAIDYELDLIPAREDMAVTFRITPSTDSS